MIIKKGSVIMRFVIFFVICLYFLLLMFIGCFGFIVGVLMLGWCIVDGFGMVVGVVGGFIIIFGFGWVWLMGGIWVFVFFVNFDVCLGMFEKDGEDVVKVCFDRVCCWNKCL